MTLGSHCHRRKDWGSATRGSATTCPCSATRSLRHRPRSQPTTSRPSSTTLLADPRCRYPHKTCWLPSRLSIIQLPSYFVQNIKIQYHKQSLYPPRYVPPVDLDGPDGSQLTSGSASQPSTHNLLPSFTFPSTCLSSTQSPSEAGASEPAFMPTGTASAAGPGASASAASTASNRGDSMGGRDIGMASACLCIDSRIAMNAT